MLLTNVLCQQARLYAQNDGSRRTCGQPAFDYIDCHHISVAQKGVIIKRLHYKLHTIYIFFSQLLVLPGAAIKKAPGAGSAIGVLCSDDNTLPGMPRPMTVL